MASKGRGVDPPRAASPASPVARQRITTRRTLMGWVMWELKDIVRPIERTVPDVAPACRSVRGPAWQPHACGEWPGCGHSPHARLLATLAVSRERVTRRWA